MIPNIHISLFFTIASFFNIFRILIGSNVDLPVRPAWLPPLNIWRLLMMVPIVNDFYKVFADAFLQGLWA
jgi:hypothetical protein